jgi:hypothetical protein
MYIELYKYVEGDESFENGEYLGYVSLEEDDVYIDLDDERLAETLEDLFSEPLSYSRSAMEPEQEIEPYTKEFFRIIPTILPDYGIRGKLQEDDIEDFEKPIKHDVDEMDDDEEEEMPVGITVDDIDEMDEMSRMDNLEEDDHYNLEHDLDDDLDGVGALSMMDEEEDY